MILLRIYLLTAISLFFLFSANMGCAQTAGDEAPLVESPVHISTDATISSTAATGYSQLISLYKLLGNQVVAELEGLVVKADAIAAANKQSLELKAKLQTIPNDVKLKAEANTHREASQRIFSSWDYMSVLSPDVMESTSPSVIQFAIKDAIAQLGKTAGDKCFPQNGIFAKNNIECQKEIVNCASYWHYGGKGRTLYSLFAESDFQVKEEPIDTFEKASLVSGADMFSGFDRGEFYEKHRKMSYLFCRLAAESGENFSPGGITVNFVWPPNISDKASDPEIASWCSNFTPNSEGQRILRGLAAKYRENSSLKYYVDVSTDGYARCSSWIQEKCVSMYVLKERVIHVYPTIGCKLREVVSEDIDADAESMRNDIYRRKTEADILNHLYIKDQIKLCQAAHEAGFAWEFKAPVVGKDCKKEE